MRDGTKPRPLLGGASGVSLPAAGGSVKPSLGSCLLPGASACPLVPPAICVSFSSPQASGSSCLPPPKGHHSSACPPAGVRASDETLEKGFYQLPSG